VFPSSRKRWRALNPNKVDAYNAARRVSAVAKDAYILVTRSNQER
jgi:hypothetical protein